MRKTSNLNRQPANKINSFLTNLFFVSVQISIFPQFYSLMEINLSCHHFYKYFIVN